MSGPTSPDGGRPDALLARRIRHLDAAERLAGLGSWQGSIGETHQGVFWSAGTYAIAGWPQGADVTFEDFLDGVHPDDRPRFLEMREQALAGRQPYGADVRFVRPDGEVRHLRIEAECEELADGTLHLIGVADDRTEEVRAAALASAARQETRDLLRELLRETEVQRSELAERVHGDPLHAATAAGLVLETLDPGGSAAEELAEIRSCIEDAIDAMRAVVQQAAPTDLGDDLEQALRRAGRVAAPTTSVEVHVDATLDLAPIVRRIVVRVAREAVHNVRKHAGAQRVEVRLERRGNEVQLVIADDGCGFDPSTAVARPGHLGLTSMQERVASVGGSFEITSAPGSTVVRARFPVGAAVSPPR